MLSACGLTEAQNQKGVSSSSSQQPPALQDSLSDSCTNERRLLNPDIEAKPSETDLDRYFRLAFNAETEGKFDKAIAHYQKVTEIAKCECDRKHALAGKQAAREAKDLLDRYGIASKPTQYFWGRLQELTEALPCVRIQE
jgi:hypothetical protein